MPINITTSPAARDCVFKNDKVIGRPSGSNSFPLAGSPQSQAIQKQMANQNAASSAFQDSTAWKQPSRTSHSGEESADTEGAVTKSISRSVSKSNVARMIDGMRRSSQYTTQQKFENNLNLFIGAVIAVNAVLIAIETDLKSPADDISVEEKAFWLILESVFIVIFVTEIAVRVYWHGFGWFCASIANIFDTALIVVMVLDTWLLSFVQDELEGVALFALLRLMRLMRLVRLLRIVRFCRGFYSMAVAFANAVKSMVWLCMMMAAGLFLFAIFTTIFIGKAKQFRDVDMGGWTGEQRFGTVFRSMYSLFELMTLEGWPNVGRPLINTEPAMFIFLFVFIMIFTFGFLNMIVAMVVEATIDQAKKMEQLSDKEQNEVFVRHLESVKQVFQDADSDHSGTLTQEEFEQAFNGSEAAQAILSYLRIGSDDARLLYDILDPFECGEIDIDEFMDGLAKLRNGAASNFDIIATSAGVRAIKNHLSELRRMLAVPDVPDASSDGRRPSTSNTSEAKPSTSEGHGIAPSDSLPIKLQEQAGSGSKDAGISPMHARTIGLTIAVNELRQRLDEQSVVQNKILSRLDELATGQASILHRFDAASITGGSADQLLPSAVTTKEVPTPVTTPRGASSELPGTVDTRESE